MILVTGATGTVGSEVVRELAGRGAPVRAFVRSLEKAAMFDGLGVDVVQGDLEDAASVATALDGADHLFLLTAVPPNQVELERGVVEAAASSGVEHIVKLSALNVADDSPVNFFRWHRETERNIEASGAGWTHLRPNNFFQNLLFQVDAIREQGAFYGPFGDAPISSIDVRDIAAVSATVLMEPGHMGKTLDLTGPVALTHAEMASSLTDALGREVSYVNVSLDDARASMLGMGMPEYIANDLTTLSGELAGGSGSGTTATVESVTGKPARPLEAFASDNARAFGS